MVGFLVAQNLRFQAVNQAALCNAVAIKIHQHVFNPQPARSQAVVLNINGVVLGAAGITNAAAAVVLVRANRRRVVRCAQIFSRDAFEAHLLQVRQRDFHCSRHIRAVVQQWGCPSAFNVQLLRRESLDANAFLLFLARHPGVEQLGRLDKHSHLVHHGRLWRLLDRRCGFDLKALRFHHRQRFNRRALDFLHIPHHFRHQAPLDGAVLRNQCILDRGVEHQEAVVLLVEHVIASVRGLRCAIYVFGLGRLKHHRFIGTGERVHQTRQHGFNCISHFGRDDRAPSVQFLVARVRLAVILPHGLETSRANEVDVFRRIFLIRLQVLEQVAIVHFCHYSASALGLRPRFGASTSTDTAFGSGSAVLPCACSSGEYFGKGGHPTRCDPSG